MSTMLLQEIISTSQLSQGESRKGGLRHRGKVVWLCLYKDWFRRGDSVLRCVAR